MLQLAFRLRTAGFLCLILAGLAAAPCGAHAQAQSPEAFISRLGNEGLQVLRPSVPPHVRTARFRELFRNDFDVPEIARFVLGPYRNALTPQQQQEFHKLFRDSIARSYADKLAHYAGDQFRVVGSRAWGGGTLVYSRVVGPEGHPVELDWQVVNRGGRYQVTDVFVDHVSMKLSERNEIAAIIQRNGGEPAAAIAALRQQLGYGS